MKWIVLGITVCMAAIFSLLPQWHLSMAIAEAKTDSLRSISELLPALAHVLF